MSIKVCHGKRDAGLTRSKTWLGISWSLLLIALKCSCSKVSFVIPYCNNVCNSFAPRISSSCLICSCRTTTVLNCWNTDVRSTIPSNLCCAGAFFRWRTASYACCTELASLYQRGPPPTRVCCNWSIQSILCSPPNGESIISLLQKPRCAWLLHASKWSAEVNEHSSVISRTSLANLFIKFVLLIALLRLELFARAFIWCSMQVVMPRTAGFRKFKTGRMVLPL